jgi:hypothetical protein
MRVHKADTEQRKVLALTCLSISTELHDSHWMDLHEVSHLGFVLKSLDKLFLD